MKEGTSHSTCFSKDQEIVTWAWFCPHIYLDIYPVLIGFKPPGCSDINYPSVTEGIEIYNSVLIWQTPVVTTITWQFQEIASTVTCPNTVRRVGSTMAH